MTMGEKFIRDGNSIVFINTFKQLLSTAKEENRRASEWTNKVFNILTYRQLLEQRRFADCIDVGLHMLNDFQVIDQETTTELHKGTPYYWMAISAYQCHDFDTAIFFFNLAAQEDIRDDNGRLKVREDHGIIKGSPALLFMLLEPRNSFQAAKSITENAANRLSLMLKKYCKLQNCFFDLDEFRQRLLYPFINEHIKWQTIINSFIGFIIEYEYRSEIISLEKSTNNIAPSIFYLHLLKGCVILESLIKNNPTNPPKPNPQKNEWYTILKRDINDLKDDLCIELDVHNLPHTTNISQVLCEIKANPPEQISDCFKYSILIRNSLAHNLIPESSLKQLEYQILIDCVVNSCLHTIKKLYRQENINQQ